MRNNVCIMSDRLGLNPVHWFEDIIDFDGIVLRLSYNMGAPSWNYCTVLPISPMGFRRNSPTKASISIEEFEEKVSFLITDDYGVKYTLIIDRALQHRIDYAITAIRENELTPSTP
jgi:hypothetical protein